MKKYILMLVMMGFLLAACQSTIVPITEQPKSTPVLEQPKPVEKTLNFTKRLELEQKYVYSVAAADFNNDGFDDVVAGVYDGISDIFINNKDGTFTKQPLTVEKHNTQKIAVIDYNKDGNPDIILGNIHEPSILFKNNGDGTFTDVKEFDSSVVYDIDVDDFDDDGYNDIAFATKFKDNVVYFNEKGTGDFTKVIYSSNLPATSIKSVDMNSDNSEDIVLGLDTRPTQVYLNKGDRSFVLSKELGNPTHTTSLETFDINNDGKTDIIQGNNKEANMIYINNGNGFDGSPEFGSGNTYALIAADFDGDGTKEVVVGNYEQKIDLYDTENGNYKLVTELPSQYEKDYVRGFAAGDFLNDGSMDLVVARENEMSEVYLSTG